jgi:protein translocase SecG subunit
VKILKNILLSAYFLVCIALIAAVTSQTSKSEGITGIGLIGGKVEAAPFLRKKTWDEQLSQITAYLAWSFLLLSTLIVILGY